ncbi:hypothetical protein [Bartonella tribocorum]|uniref:hypothetical protein n=1 Tax=Bartonella tribocorum TaxID=85701 RepID=UPI001AECFF0D
MNRFKCQSCPPPSGAGKVCNNADLLLHKRKDGKAQWLYRYTIHGYRHEMSLSILKGISLINIKTLASHKDFMIAFTKNKQKKKFS